MTSRRGFLLGIGAALAAPAIVRADSLMKLWVPPAPKLLTVLDDYEEGTFTPTITFDWQRTASWVEYQYVRVGDTVKLGQPVAIKGGVAWAV